VTAVVLLPTELIGGGVPALPQRPVGAPAGVDRPRPALIPGPDPTLAPSTAASAPAEPVGATPIPLTRRTRTVPRLGPRPALAPADPAAPPANPPAAPPATPTTPGPAATPPRPKIVPEIIIPNAPATPAARPAQPPLSEDGLPRRIRQASLAPQLREPSAPPPESSAAVLDRSPDEIRARMRALQSGTRRGRVDGRDNLAGPTADRGGNGQGAAPTAVPYQLAGPAGAPIALDVPFTGALGPIGTKEEWFTPSRAEPPEATAAPTDPEEDA
jgi:hypothetical protein